METLEIVILVVAILIVGLTIAGVVYRKYKEKKEKKNNPSKITCSGSCTGCMHSASCSALRENIKNSLDEDK